jgi:hypothetical protein
VTFASALPVICERFREQRPWSGGEVPIIDGLEILRNPDETFLHVETISSPEFIRTKSFCLQIVYQYRNKKEQKIKGNKGCKKGRERE